MARGLCNSLRNVPGPWVSKFTNLRLKIAVVTGQRIHYIHSLHEQYEPFVRIGPHEVSVNDHNSFAQIYSVKVGLEKSKWYKDGTTRAFRPTFFTMQDNKSHSARRKLFAKPFSKFHTRQNWESHIKQRVKLTFEKIRGESEQFGSADLLKWFTLMASDVSSHLMFGESFHKLETGEMSQFMRYLVKALQGAAIGNELPLFRAIGQHLPIQALQELFNTDAYLADYADIAVKNMRAQRQSANLFATAQVEAEKGQKLDDVDVRLEAVGLFVAGTDTTANTMTYLVWAVLLRPVLREQLEREVAGLSEGYPDAEVENLTLLNAIIEETLRLYGAVPGMQPPDVPAGGLELRGYFIPEGNIVGSQAFSLHRDPELWFDPLGLVSTPRDGSTQTEAEGIGKVSKAAKPVFNPFGSGSRGCLGQHIAYSELRLATAEFFRQCSGARLAPSTTPESMELENFFIITPKAHRCDVVV